MEEEITASGKHLVKIGVNYDSAKRTLGNWIIAEDQHRAMT